MNISKVIYGGRVLMDLTSDNLNNSNQLLEGVTAHSSNGSKLVGSIPSLYSNTYIPGTIDQTIESGNYIKEDQIIKGDANLLPENIAEGVNIFGVTGTAKGGVDVQQKPNITFNSTWFPWRIEFYDDIAYWEAWFFSSGTLSVTGSYEADAWGIGGGGGAYNDYAGGSGYVRQVLNTVLSGDIAVTIGAGASGGQTALGGDTTLGTLLTCPGGGANGSTSQNVTKGGSAGGARLKTGSVTYTQYLGGIDGGGNDLRAGEGIPMRRFGDMTKDNDYAHYESTSTSPFVHDRVAESGQGWFPFGTGFGSGGNYGSKAGTSGALVIRIKV